MGRARIATRSTAIDARSRTSTISFFDLYLRVTKAAATALHTIGNQPGLTTLQQG